MQGLYSWQGLTYFLFLIVLVYMKTIIKKEYNIAGKVDRPNNRIINRIMKLKAQGVSFSIIAKSVERSPKRVKELYYREKEKLSTTGKA